MKTLLTLEQVRALKPEEAKKYCGFLRSYLVKNVTQSGGHLASNLGIVEISMALARVLDMPREKVVYDTGHQCYVHKILTGRGNDFSGLRSLGGISGFPRREESKYDAFGTGHSGTGISAALAFAKANRLNGDDGFSVAVIGDGSFTGGEAFEALNNISSKDRLIIILNDNGMSISKSVGSLRKSLNRMRNVDYYHFKSDLRQVLEEIPYVGKSLTSAARFLKDGFKRQAVPSGNLFEEMGLHYFGPADGNDLAQVEFLLKEAIKRGKPSLIHLCTQKGKGYDPAEEDPSRYHGISPAEEKKSSAKSFSKLFGEAMCTLAEENRDLCAITSAMCDGVGLGEFRKEYPDRFFDTGIAEEHAMTFAAGLSAAGKKPVFAVYSTFYQRAVDQLLHDAALQKLPICVCLDRAGFSGEDGATHHGLFDVALTLPIPGVRIFTPATGGELKQALKEAVAEDSRPTVIRYPKGGESLMIAEAFPCEQAVETKYYHKDKPCDIAVFTYGRITENVLIATEAFAAQHPETGIVIYRFSRLTELDVGAIADKLQGVKHLLFAEEGIRTGSFSEHLLSSLISHGLQPKGKVKIAAIEDSFVPHGKTQTLFALTGLDAEGIGKELKGFAEN